jgi:type IV pilus assembly protein PilA
MIVVVIIGLLAAMAIPAFQKVRTGSQDKTVLNNARQLSAAPTSTTSKTVSRR